MMTRKIKPFFFLLLLLGVKLFAEVSPLSFETISNEEALCYERNKKIDHFEEGYHKTIVRASPLPTSSCVFKWKRPLLGKEFSEEFSTELISTISNFIEEGDAVIFFSSKGFLPGEKVTLTLETPDGERIGGPIEFCPHPIIQDMRSGTAKLIAELVLLAPTKYEISFEGIPSFETLKMRSFSSGEVIENEFQYRKGLCVGLLPGVIGKNGGLCDLSIRRPKRDAFEVTLPWGEELLKHHLGVQNNIFNFFKTEKGVFFARK